MNLIDFSSISLFRNILLFSVYLVSSHLFAGECEQWQFHPEWLWCDDFEGNKTLNENYQDVGKTGLSVITGEAFEGSHSLQQHYVSGQVGAGWIIRVNNAGYPNHLFMRWYHKFEKGFNGFPPKMARMRYQQHNDDWFAPLEIHCWINNNVVVADVKAIHSTQANSTGWLPVIKSSFSFNNPANVGRWVCFEMEVSLNSLGKSDGLYRIWADDSLIVERTNADLRGSEKLILNEVMLDCYWNSGSPKDQNRYYDNFIISTKKIGPFRDIATPLNHQPVKNRNLIKSKSSLQGLLKNSKSLSSGIYLNFYDKSPDSHIFSLDGKRSVNKSSSIDY